MPGTTTLDRIIVVAVAVLIAAFTLGALGPLVSPAAGDEVAGTRDDTAAEIEAVEEDDDDGDPFARGDDDSGDGGGDSGANSRSGDSGSRSIGSHSANTATGTTRNTGVSKTVSNSKGASKNTATGTTRGTGPSKTVSNSS